ncbi:MAG: acylphosphatase [Euryarchaeota archaeon]|nr:acylphosphatase [Euryarchaeota archaeon]
MRVQAHIIGYGRVKNIFWAYALKEFAQRHNITGWVKITSSESVEIILQGEKEKVEALVKWMYTGNQYGKITHAKVVWNNNFNTEYRNFTVMR